MNGISFSLIFLGVITKISKKSGKPYSVAKFFAQSTNDTFEFFLGDEELLVKVQALKQFLPALVYIDISSFQGEPKIKLAGVEQK